MFGVLLSLPAQQIPDRGFFPPVFEPRFPLGDGPIVQIDAAHNNLHTADGGYFPFANILRRDGFRVGSLKEPFRRKVLDGVDVLVVVNALHDANRTNWESPARPAFAKDELRAVVNWVNKGGSLFLVADHQPFPAAASELASAFGFRFHDGWAVLAPNWSTDISFSRADNSLARHPVTSGESADEEVRSVVTFGGSAFEVPNEATSILTFRGNFYSFQPCNTKAFDSQTDPHIPIDGWSQRAVRSFGRGRVAVFGEAGMFTAQLAGPDRQPFGINSVKSAQNLQLLLNLVRWLARTEN